VSDVVSRASLYRPHQSSSDRVPHLRRLLSHPVISFGDIIELENPMHVRKILRMGLLATVALGGALQAGTLPAAAQQSSATAPVLKPETVEWVYRIRYG
jgi:hypothetical protein